MMITRKLVYSFEHNERFVEIIKHNGSGDMHYHVYLDGCLTPSYFPRSVDSYKLNSLIDICDLIMNNGIVYGSSIYMQKFFMSIPEEYPELFL